MVAGRARRRAYVHAALSHLLTVARHDFAALTDLAETDEAVRALVHPSTEACEDDRVAHFVLRLCCAPRGPAPSLLPPTMALGKASADHPVCNSGDASNTSANAPAPASGFAEWCIDMETLVYRYAG